MNTILWLALILFVGVPVAAFLFGLFFDFEQAQRGKQSKLKTLIAAIASVFLFVMSITDMFSGIFSSIKTFVIFALKIITCGVFFANWVVALSGSRKRNTWSYRINNSLNNQLGNTLKKYLPTNSHYYSVDNTQGNMAIYFFKDNKQRMLTFQSLGYEDLPAIYTDIVCQWIQENIVCDKSNYKIQEIYTKVESWEGGSSDYIETHRTSTGFESHRVSGDPGRRTTRKITYGYKLVHKEHITSTQKQALNKW